MSLERASTAQRLIRKFTADGEQVSRLLSTLDERRERWVETLSLRHVRYMPRWEVGRRYAGPLVAVTSATLAGCMGAHDARHVASNGVQSLAAGGFIWLVAQRLISRLASRPLGSEQAVQQVAEHLRVSFESRFTQLASSTLMEATRHQTLVPSSLTEGSDDPDHCAWEGARRAVEGMNQCLRRDFKKRRARGGASLRGPGALFLETGSRRPTLEGNDHRFQLQYSPTGVRARFEVPATRQQVWQQVAFARDVLLPLLHARLDEASDGAPSAFTLPWQSLPGPLREELAQLAARGSRGELLEELSLGTRQQLLDDLVRGALSEATGLINASREGGRPRLPPLSIVLQPYPGSTTAEPSDDLRFTLDVDLQRPTAAGSLQRRQVVDVVKRLAEQLGEVGHDGIAHLKVEDSYFAHSAQPAQVLDQAIRKLLRLHPELHRSFSGKVEEGIWTVRFSREPQAPGTRRRTARRLGTQPPEPVRVVDVDDVPPVESLYS